MYTIGGYFYHHGIQGQRWGVRNGPPYPLSDKNHSKLENEAKKKRSWHDISSTTQGSFKRKGLTEKQKKYIRNGAIVAGIALAAIGTVYLTKSGKINDLINVGRGSIPKDVLKNALPDNLGFKKIEKSESARVRLSKCNPNMTAVEKTGVYKSAHNMNCGNCVAANEMRNRGLDVQACGNENGMTFSQMAQYFDGIHSGSIIEPGINVSKLSDETSYLMAHNSITPKVAREIDNRGKQVYDQITKDILKQYPNGSRGAMIFTGRNGTHWISWENVNGKINFENPQDPSNPVFANIKRYFGTFVKHPGASTKCIRFDDLKIKDTIREIVTDFGAEDDFGDFNSHITRGINFVMKN